MYCAHCALWDILTFCVGSIFHGYYVDRIGRRKLLLLSNIFYIVGPIVTAFSPSSDNVGSYVALYPQCIAS